MSKRLFHAKMKEGDDIGAYVNSKIRSTKELENLDFTMDAQL